MPATFAVLGASLTGVTVTSRVLATELAAELSTTVKETVRVALVGSSLVELNATDCSTVSYCARVAAPVSASAPFAPGVTVMPNWAVAAS